MTGKHWDTGSGWPSLVPRKAAPKNTTRAVLPVAEDWMERGACVGRWPQWDGTVEGETQAEREARQGRAAQVCRTQCPVLAECRAWSEKASSVGEFGVVGGRATRLVTGKFRSRWIELQEEVA